MPQAGQQAGWQLESDEDGIADNPQREQDALVESSIWEVKRTVNRSVHTGQLNILVQ